MFLEGIIREEIRIKGPLSLSRYMELCLYHPHHGYYMTKNPFEDFITSPEISSLFGETIALCLETIGREQGYEAVSLVELGGGRGLLMEDMARTFQTLSRPVSSYHMVEVSPVLKACQQETLKNFPVVWTENLPAINEGPVLIVANEFFDAFPVDQYIFTELGWQERCIDSDLRWVARSTSFSPPSAWPSPKIGDIFEDPVTVRSYFQSILDLLKTHGGIFLTVDYGHSHRAYGDTFQALFKHQYVDPLKSPGEHDLTTHVNFKILFDEAQEAGFEPLSLLTQGDFLKHYGIQERMGSLLKMLSPQKQTDLLKALKKLMHSQEMGSLFKVMIIVH